MPRPSRLWVVIPALDEERAIGRVLDALPRDLPLTVVVADNGSTDRTTDEAATRGAEVVREARRGYGRACLAGLSRVRQLGARAGDVVAFLDGDFSDDPSELPRLVEPILAGRADLVVGSRTLGAREKGALLPQARFGNWLATRLLRAITGVRFSDLGPFRAMRWEALESLDMQDPAFGWTVEMQLKAATRGLRCIEVPVRYRRRIGASKISGTVRGSFLAGRAILGVLLRHVFAFGVRSRRKTPGKKSGS